MYAADPFRWLIDSGDNISNKQGIMGLAGA